MTGLGRGFLIACAAFILLTACRKDETVTAYGAAKRTWHLTEVDEQAVTYEATLRFPEAGLITGDAPCNTYFATMTVPYPWFEAQDIAATRRACPELASETAFLLALSQMTLSEVLGDTLILSTPEGRKMLFKAHE